MANNRSKPRRQVHKAGRIMFGGSGMTCTIHNLSAGGATIECAGPDQIPEQFTLALEMEQRVHTCRVVWRQALRIGLQFLD